MKSFVNTLQNSICHIVLDGVLHSKFIIVVYLIMTLQTISIIVSPDSTIYMIVRWVDPSNYLPASFSIVVGLVIILSFLIILIVKTMMTESTQVLGKPTTLKIYFGNILIHQLVLCKTILMIPLIRSCILSLASSSGAVIRWVGLVLLLIYFLVLLPILVYNSSNTFILTPQVNKKVNFFNIYIVFIVFRIIFAVVSALNQSAIIVPCSLFFFIFMILAVKQPIFIYSNEKTVKAMISAVAYVSLCPLLEFIMNHKLNSLLIEIVGMVGFIAFIQRIGQIRIRKILDLPTPSLHQIKILIFLVLNLQEYIQKLEYFILKHHKQCTHVDCKCKAVIEALTSVQGKFEDDRVWFQFLISYVGNYYSLQKIEQLPQTQMLQQTEKYCRVVIDLAQIHLFKLGQINISYYIISAFREHLRNKGLSFLSFDMKSRIINYYMQEQISAKYNTEGVTNTLADKYMHFQIRYDKYRKMLIRSATKTAEMWEEMNKRQPDDQKLKNCVQLLEQWYWRIRTNYININSEFENSAEILQDITNDYFEAVLNIPSKSPFHVIEVPKFKSTIKKKEEKVEKLSENMQAFSLNSETPICFVSVEEHSFGQLTGSNYFFNEITKMGLAKVTHMDDFMIPQMRAAHKQHMKTLIEGDGFSTNHNNGFIVNSKGKLIYSKVLVQIMPSIFEGLRYVFYLKKVMHNRKIATFRNNFTLPYSTESFDQLFQSNVPKQAFLNEETFEQLKENRQATVSIQGQEFFLRCLHEFTDKEITFFFVEFCESETQTEFVSTLKTNKLVKDTDAFKSTNNSGMSYEEEKEEEKGLTQKLKKEEEVIRDVYWIIVDNNTKNIAFRVVVFTLIIFSLFVVTLLTAIFLKQNNSSTYLQADKINSHYSNFMLLITRAVSYAKLANINSFQNKNLTALNDFNTLQNLTNVNQAMDALVVNFDIGTITQTWNYFSCNSNGSFNVGRQSNFLAVSDYIQNAITNIVALSPSSLSFPIDIRYIPTPFSAGSLKLQELVTNSLYVTIPNFRSLKSQTMDPIILNSVNTLVMMLMVFVSQIVIITAFIVGMLIVNKRVIELKNHSYRLFESLSQRLIKQKEEKCRNFIYKYTNFDEQIAMETTDNFTRKKNREDTIFEQPYIKPSRNLEGYNHEQTEYEMQSGRDSNINIIINNSIDAEPKDFNPDTNPDSFLDNDFKMNTLTKSKIATIAKMEVSKTQQIFEKASLGCVVLKYLLPVIPLIVFSMVFGSLQITQVSKIKNFLTIQSKIQTIQLDINLVQLYALHYAVYDPSMQKYQSIPKTLTSLINEMYSISRAFGGNSSDLISLPITQSFMNSIAYNNLCSMFGGGNFLKGSISNNTFSSSQCSAIGDKILQKGFYSSMISYLEGIGTLLLSYPNLTAGNFSQKLQYLNSNFFKMNSQLIGYFDSIIATLLSLFEQDYNNQINNSKTSLVYTALAMLALLFLLAACFNCIYIQTFKTEIIEITSIFLLVSYKTILKNENLKNQFTQQLEVFKKLK